MVHVFPAAAAGEEVFDSAVAAAALALAEEAFLLKIDLEVHLAVVAAFDLELGSAADRIDSAWEVFAAALALALVLATLLEEGIGC